MMTDTLVRPETHSEDLPMTVTAPREAGLPELPVIELTQPMPGFPALRRFALVRIDESGLLCELRSVDDPDTSFLVVPPAPFFPDYVAEVDEDAVTGLEIAQADDVLLLVVVTAGSSLATSTANLAAPVLVNVHTRRAQQVVLDDASLALAAPLVEG